MFKRILQGAIALLLLAAGGGFQSSWAQQFPVKPGVVAKRFPDVSFMIYHSGFIAGVRADPHYLTYGPKTRREFLDLMRWNGGEPA